MSDLSPKSNLDEYRVGHNAKDYSVSYRQSPTRERKNIRETISGQMSQVHENLSRLP